MKIIIMAAGLFILMTNQAYAMPTEQQEGSASPYTGSANSSGPGGINSPEPLNGNSSATLDANGVDTGNTMDSGEATGSGGITDNSTGNPKADTTGTPPGTMNSMKPSSGGGP